VKVFNISLINIFIKEILEIIKSMEGEFLTIKMGISMLGK
jgi:hypothetical protein